MSSSDTDLFFQQMADVTPLKQDAIELAQGKSDKALNVFYKQQASKRCEYLNEQLSHCPVEYVEPDDYISFKSPGLQAGVFKNLRLAKYDIDARIELQGLSIKHAQQQLLQELNECQRRNIRVVLIKHGVGIDNVEQPAKLKSHVNAWLRCFPFVLGFHTAQTHHGGYGAVYVLLSKNEQAKLANKEIHAKK